MQAENKTSEKHGTSTVPGLRKPWRAGRTVRRAGSKKNFELASAEWRAGAKTAEVSRACTPSTNYTSAYFERPPAQMALRIIVGHACRAHDSRLS